VSDDRRLRFWNRKRMRLRRTRAYCGTREHVQRDNRRTNFLKSVSAGIKGSHFRRCDRVPVPPEIAIWHTSALTAARRWSICAPLSANCARRSKTIPRIPFTCSPTCTWAIALPMPRPSRKSPPSPCRARFFDLLVGKCLPSTKGPGFPGPFCIQSRAVEERRARISPWKLKQAHRWPGRQPQAASGPTAGGVWPHRRWRLAAPQVAIGCTAGAYAIFSRLIGSKINWFVFGSTPTRTCSPFSTSPSSILMASGS